MMMKEGRKKLFEFFKLWEALLLSSEKQKIMHMYIIRLQNNMNILDSGSVLVIS